MIPSSLYPCPCYFKRPRDKLRLSSVEIPKSEKGSTDDSIRFIKETLLSLSLQSVFFTDIPLPRRFAEKARAEDELSQLTNYARSNFSFVDENESVRFSR